MSPMMTLNTDNGYILVVHSDPVMRDWLAENLSACGHTVAICDNAEEGLALFRRDRHQLIIADLELSQQKLLSVLVDESPQTPVITVSGEVPMEVVLEALKNGAVDHFFKNRDVLVLTHTVQRALERGRLLRENREYQQQLEAANAEIKKQVVEFNIVYYHKHHLMLLTLVLLVIVFSPPYIYRVILLIISKLAIIN